MFLSQSGGGRVPSSPQTPRESGTAAASLRQLSQSAVARVPKRHPLGKASVCVVLQHHAEIPKRRRQGKASGCVVLQQRAEIPKRHRLGKSSGCVVLPRPKRHRLGEASVCAALPRVRAAIDDSFWQVLLASPCTFAPLSGHHEFAELLPASRTLSIEALLRRVDFEL